MTFRSVSRLIACGCLVLASAACHRKEPVQSPPLGEAERQQFISTLELAAWRQPGSWPQFAHDPLHTGRTDVDLGSSDLQLKWQFRPTTRVWAYRKGYAVWSPPVAGTVDGRALVIAGHYDRVVYAVDGRTGEKVWTFRPGALVFASPALGRIAGRPVVFLAASNRSIYAVDATSGEKRWVFETLPWTFTQTQSVMSSPTLVRDGEQTTLIVGVWNADRSAARNLQSGELVVLDAADGTLRWRQRLASVPVTSPAVARIDGELMVFVAAHHGGVWALRLADGSTKWQTLLNEQTRSSPSLGLVDGTARCFIGTRFHTLHCLDLQTGAEIWRRQTGYWIDGTPTWFDQGAETTVVAGSYDRRVYGFDGSDGAVRWDFQTGNFAHASAVSAMLQGKRAVLAMSWDEHLYLLDAAGRQMSKARSGPLLWSHVQQGDSLWSGPVVAQFSGRPFVYVAAFDGVLYAYGPPDP